jgi:acetyl-CoA decarbonylase/synthase complex subunit gamma
MRSAIRPGLYAVGSPTAESPVFVSANYKMSFDRLRSQLSDRDGWIMVLDTRGINVWCAAGKGTFGTDEIVNRLRVSRMGELVAHRKLILPQLGGPGIKAHEVKKQAGFTARFGPVRAADLPAWLDNDRKATPEMRLVRFRFGDRLVLVPAEIIGYGTFGLLMTLILALLSGFGSGLYSLNRVWVQGLSAAVPFLGGILAGAVLVPALLPWLPGRAFSAKGVGAGIVYLLVLGIIVLWRPELAPGWAGLVAWLFLIPALASFVGMNFTGSSTYTSLSGVRKEMRAWVRPQAAAFLVGLGFWIAGRFL